MQQKPALSEPPQVKVIAFSMSTLHVRKKTLVLQNRLDHGLIPSSCRTCLTPSTMFLNFFLAAHRAVWLKPQSGAKESRSGGAYFKQSFTRSAMSLAVSR